MRFSNQTPSFHYYALSFWQEWKGEATLAESIVSTKLISSPFVLRMHWFYSPLNAFPIPNTSAAPSTKFLRGQKYYISLLHFHKTCIGQTNSHDASSGELRWGMVWPLLYPQSEVWQRSGIPSINRPHLHVRFLSKYFIWNKVDDGYVFVT